MKKIRWFFPWASIMSILCASQLVFADDIALPDPTLDPNISLQQALNMRKSQRSFSSKKLSDEQLSSLLWAANGVNRQDSGRRTAPSACDWREINIYVALEKGLYQYNADAHALKNINDKDLRKICGFQEFTQDAPVNLIYVVDYNRMTNTGLNVNEPVRKFYAATDTGFISQNVYLYCAAEGLATVVLGWINKEVLAKEMELTENQEIVLTQPVGFPK